jgi:hypothetical protein
VAARRLISAPAADEPEDAGEEIERHHDERAEEEILEPPLNRLEAHVVDATRQALGNPHEIQGVEVERRQDEPDDEGQDDELEGDPERAVAENPGTRSTLSR